MSAVLTRPVHVAQPVQLSAVAAALDKRLAVAESSLTYVDYHAYGRLDTAECQSLAKALEEVRAVRTALKALST